ncbi:MAG: ArsR/SmtB family transcription factor [Chloroflexota bacterium]
MPYIVEVDWAPIYELTTSLDTYAAFRRMAKTLELPADWSEAIRARGGERLARALSDGDLSLGGAELLVWQCPGERTTEAVLAWIEGLSLDELTDRLLRYTPDEWRRQLRNLGELRERWLRAVRLWDEIYFRSLDPEICRGLAADAAEKRKLIKQLAPEDLIELATAGVRFDPTAEQQRVVLVPQFHMRPWNTYQPYRDIIFYHYPVDALLPAPGEVPPAVARLVRALADTNRLQILRYLAAGTRGFKDIVQFTGLAKSTVHHHMVALRAAGLVRVHPRSATIDHYSLRPDALDRLGSRLVSFIKGD